MPPKAKRKQPAAVKPPVTPPKPPQPPPPRARAGGEIEVRFSPQTSQKLGIIWKAVGLPGFLSIDSVREGTPASTKADLRPGLRLVELNGESVWCENKDSARDVSKKLKTRPLHLLLRQNKQIQPGENLSKHLAPEELAAIEQLGWTAATWDGGSREPFRREWETMPSHEQTCAETILKMDPKQFYTSDSESDDMEPGPEPDSAPALAPAPHSQPDTQPGTNVDDGVALDRNPEPELELDSKQRKDLESETTEPEPEPEPGLAPFPQPDTQPSKDVNAGRDAVVDVDACADVDVAAAMRVEKAKEAKAQADRIAAEKADRIAAEKLKESERVQKRDRHVQVRGFFDKLRSESSVIRDAAGIDAMEKRLVDQNICREVELRRLFRRDNLRTLERDYGFTPKEIKLFRQYRNELNAPQHGGEPEPELQDGIPPCRGEGLQNTLDGPLKPLIDSTRELAEELEKMSNTTHSVVASSGTATSGSGAMMDEGSETSYEKIRTGLQLTETDPYEIITAAADTFDVSFEVGSTLRERAKLICQRLDLKTTIRDLKEMDPSKKPLTVSVVGEGKNGKSTLLNAVIGEAVLPMMDGVACTASICRIRHSNLRYLKAKVRNVDGVRVRFLRSEEPADTTNTRYCFEITRHQESWLIKVTHQDFQSLQFDLENEMDKACPSDKPISDDALRKMMPNFQSREESEMFLSLYWDFIPAELKSKGDEEAEPDMFDVVYEAGSKLGFDTSKWSWPHIKHVKPHSNAEKRRLRAGMFIVQINGESTEERTAIHFEEMLRNTRPLTIRVRPLTARQQRQWDWELAEHDRVHNGTDVAGENSWEQGYKGGKWDDASACVEHRVFVEGLGDGVVVSAQKHGTAWKGTSVTLHTVDFGHQTQAIKLLRRNNGGTKWLVQKVACSASSASGMQVSGPRTTFANLKDTLPKLPKQQEFVHSMVRSMMMVGGGDDNRTGNSLQIYLQALIDHPLLLVSPALSKFPPTPLQRSIGYNDEWVEKYQQTAPDDDAEAEDRARSELAQMAEDWCSPERETVEEVEIGLPGPRGEGAINIIEDGVILVDAPGMNQDAARDQVLRAEIKKSHTVLFVTNALVGTTQEEKKKWTEWKETQGRGVVPRVLCNKFDLLKGEVTTEKLSREEALQILSEHGDGFRGKKKEAIAMWLEDHDDSHVAQMAEKCKPVDTSRQRQNLEDAVVEIFGEQIKEERERSNATEEPLEGSYIHFLNSRAALEAQIKGRNGLVEPTFNTMRETVLDNLKQEHERELVGRPIDTLVDLAAELSAEISRTRENSQTAAEAPEAELTALKQALTVAQKLNLEPCNSASSEDAGELRRTGSATTEGFKGIVDQAWQQIRGATQFQQELIDALQQNDTHLSMQRALDGFLESKTNFIHKQQRDKRFDNAMMASYNNQVRSRLVEQFKEMMKQKQQNAANRVAKIFHQHLHVQVKQFYLESIVAQATSLVSGGLQDVLKKLEQDDPDDDIVDVDIDVVEWQGDDDPGLFSMWTNLGSAVFGSWEKEKWADITLDGSPTGKLTHDAPQELKQHGESYIQNLIQKQLGMLQKAPSEQLSDDVKKTIYGRVESISRDWLANKIATWQSSLKQLSQERNKAIEINTRTLEIEPCLKELLQRLKDLQTLFTEHFVAHRTEATESLTSTLAAKANEMAIARLQVPSTAVQPPPHRNQQATVGEEAAKVVGSATEAVLLQHADKYSFVRGTLLRFNLSYPGAEKLGEVSHFGIFCGRSAEHPEGSVVDIWFKVDPKTEDLSPVERLGLQSVGDCPCCPQERSIADFESAARLAGAEIEPVSVCLEEEFDPGELFTPDEAVRRARTAVTAASATVSESVPGDDLAAGGRNPWLSRSLDFVLSCKFKRPESAYAKERVPTCVVTNGQQAKWIRSYTNSSFRQEQGVVPTLRHQHDLFKAVYTLINGSIKDMKGITPERGDVFFHDLQNEAFKKQRQVLDALPHAAQQLWTSAIKLRPSDEEMADTDGFVDTLLVADKLTENPVCMEFCSILNQAIRSDRPTLMPAVATIAAGINELLVSKDDEDFMTSLKRRLKTERAPFPPAGKCYRGGGFPADKKVRDFFDDHLNKKYRVPGYLATSFDEEVAQRFIENAPKDQPVVKWIIQLDTRGETDPVFRCKNVNLIENTHFPDELEFLFAAYSVFTVKKLIWSQGTPEDPHIIELEAAVDSTVEENEDKEKRPLALAPWY